MSHGLLSLPLYHSRNRFVAASYASFCMTCSSTYPLSLYANQPRQPILYQLGACDPEQSLSSTVLCNLSPTGVYHSSYPAHKPLKQTNDLFRHQTSGMSTKCGLSSSLFVASPSLTNGWSLFSLGASFSSIVNPASKCASLLTQTLLIRLIAPLLPDRVYLHSLVVDNNLYTQSACLCAAMAYRSSCVSPIVQSVVFDYSSLNHVGLLRKLPA